MISAVFVGGLPPPTKRILPGWYMTAEPYERAPKFMLGPRDHAPVPATSSQRDCCDAPA